MKSNRFMSLSLDVWHNPKVLGLVSVRGGDDPMLTSGRFIRFVGLCYEYDGCIDWGDAVVRAVVSGELGMDEDDCTGFLRDMVKVGFLDRAMWESEQRAVSDGVAKEIAYRKGKSEAGKAGSNKRWNRENAVK